MTNGHIGVKEKIHSEMVNMERIFQYMQSSSYLLAENMTLRKLVHLYEIKEKQDSIILKISAAIIVPKKNSRLLVGLKFNEVIRENP